MMDLSRHSTPRVMQQVPALLRPLAQPLAQPLVPPLVPPLGQPLEQQQQVVST
jgi:hypothetical protein